MRVQSIRKSFVKSLSIDEEKKRVLNRRLNKLKKDPKGFFKGSYEKRSEQIAKRSPIKHNGYNDYTVVSAVYNVGEYLDDYFKSLVNQSLSFKKNIQLILVDDGSTDNSAEIIKSWQKKYPKNITYLYKKNGGIASARNLGIEYVNTEWVTFIDSDDFINSNYFKIVDDAIVQEKEIELVVANLMFYYDKNKKVKDSHPLKYRFKDSKSIVPISRLDANINLFVTVTFFKTNHIKQNNIIFDESIKPNFEDGKFIADYLLELATGNVIYLKDAIFYYRKRGDGSSTIDNSWQNKGKFHEVLKYGYIPMLRSYEDRYGFVPKNIQWTVIYEMSWHLNNFVNKADKLYFLDEKDKEVYLSLIKEVFKYLDEENIMSFHLNKFWFFYKVGALGAFKDSEPPFQIAYIERIDEIKKQVLVTLFTYYKVPMSITLNDIDKIPCYNKIVINSFAGRLFAHEYRSWVSYNDLKDILNVKISNRSVRISLKGKLYNNGVSVNKIRDAFIPSKQYFSDGSWLLMDRETKADDNAEHFYRYMAKSNPEQKCYFALNKSSRDWQRLEEDGFNLLDFGSENFEKKLQRASKVISSHLEAHINNYFGDNYDFSKDFIFLQHGVIKHDLSNWINTKKNINVFVTTTIDEYKSIAKSPNTYKITDKEVVLTGLPRHDALLDNYLEVEKVILIMPTWRHYLVGESIGKGVNTRSLNSKFFESEYAKNWISLLNNQSLHKLVSKHGYKIVFAPHSNIAPYLPFFDLPDYIELWSSLDSDKSIQNLFKRVTLLVTDYSSVAFEMGVLNKATVYYQFDRDEMFSGAHTVQRGYFSYENDGFGPVVTQETELLLELERILANNGKPLKPYAQRIQESFVYRDTNNCQRVYEAILDLDRSDNQEVNVSILYEMTLSAYENEVWGLVESRSDLLIQYGSEVQKNWAQTLFKEALFNQNKLTDLLDAIENNDVVPEEKKYWQAKVAFATTNWHKTIYLLKDISVLDNYLKLMLLYSYAKVGQIAEFEELKSQLYNDKLDIVVSNSPIIQSWSLLLYEEWEEIVQLLEVELPKFNVQELTDYLPQLLMAEAYRRLSKFSEAHQQLVNFESHTVDNINCRMEIAQLAFARDNYAKCIDQYTQAVNGVIYLLPETAAWQYLISHWNMNHIEVLIELLPEIIILYPNNIDFRLLYIQALTEQSKWESIIENASTLEKRYQSDVIYSVTLAKYRSGLIDEAYKDCIKPTNEHSYKYWALVSEIALLVEDNELAEYCYKGMIAIYPEHDSAENWARLNSLRNNT